MVLNMNTKPKSVLWIFLKRNLLIPAAWTAIISFLFIGFPIIVGRLIGGEAKNIDVAPHWLAAGALHWIFGLLCITVLLLIVNVVLAIIVKFIEVKEWLVFKWDEAKKEANSN